MSRKKSPYPFFSNLKFLFSEMWKQDKKMSVFLFVKAPVMVLLSFLGVYLSKEVVRAVTEGCTPEQLLLTIGSISLGLIVCGVCDKYLSAALVQFAMVNDLHMEIVLLDKTVTMDYENLENPEGLTKLAKAMDNCGSDQSTSRIASDTIASFLANAAGIVSYAGILTVLSPWITLTVIATTIAGFFLLKLIGKWNYEHRDCWKTYDRKLNYLATNSGDFQRAKDMRLYQMTHWFLDVFAQTLSERTAWLKKEQAFGFKVDFGMAALSFLREGITYGVLVFLIFGRGMSADDFVLYFGLIGGFATWLLGLANNLETLNRLHLGFTEMREYMDISDRQNHGKGIPLPAETFSIEFQNVCYRYAKSETDTIHDLSFRIEKGEKIAIVGLNGAGKTTLIKLMCGLYTPTSGRILIDGKPVSDYNIADYYSLFSVVFQEIYMLPVSIARNVSAQTERRADESRVIDALKLAGLWEKVSSLPDGIQTRLIKSVYEDAVDFSGGEMQKLALARALYKDGKALILDEPTAALDPIAESRIYEEYNRMAQHHTSVFISHRLASTRFCDRIFFLEHGKIVETGTHDQLLKQGGKYAKMFEMQSHYYREEGNDHDCER